MNCEIPPFLGIFDVGATRDVARGRPFAVQHHRSRGPSAVVSHWCDLAFESLQTVSRIHAIREREEHSPGTD